MKKVVSFFLFFVFLISLFAGSAFAVAGDSSGSFSDFPFLRIANSTGNVILGSASSSGMTLYSYRTSSSTSAFFAVLYVLPSLLNSGSVTLSSGFSNVSSVNSISTYNIQTYLLDGTTVESFASGTGNAIPLGSSCSLTSPCQIIKVSFTASYSASATSRNIVFYSSSFTYSDFVYDTSSGGSGYDPSLDQDILDGVSVIAQSLLDLETGPYSGVTDVSPDSNGDLQHTVVSTASLEDLLNALGIAGTDTNHVIRGIYNNFGSYFTCYSINDTTSGTVQVYHGLPQYVDALGSSLTDGINRLQRDNDILYNSIQSVSSAQIGLNTTLQDALYEDTDSSPSESWSVTRWLKELVSSVSTFFSSFWSEGETELKSDAEPAYQEAHDQGLVPSDSDVSDFGSVSSGLSDFASGSSSVGIIGEIPKSEYYVFWSQEVKDSLLPQSQTRGQSSSEDFWLPADSPYYDLFGKGDSR